MIGEKDNKTVVLDMKLLLPDGLAREAEAFGLLTPDSLEAMLRAELRRRRTQELFDAADRLAALETPPLTEEEIAAEIQAVRNARRRPDANRH